MHDVCRTRAVLLLLPPMDELCKELNRCRRSTREVRVESDRHSEQVSILDEHMFLAREREDALDELTLAITSSVTINEALVNVKAVAEEKSRRALSVNDAPFCNDDSTSPGYLSSCNVLTFTVIWSRVCIVVTVDVLTRCGSLHCRLHAPSFFITCR